MRSRRHRNNSTPFSLFSFQDIITGISGIMIFVLLILSLELTVPKKEKDAVEETRKTLFAKDAMEVFEAGELEIANSHTALTKMDMLKLFLKDRAPEIQVEKPKPPPVVVKEEPVPVEPPPVVVKEEPVVENEFQARVLKSSGQYEGVDVRATLIWNNKNDLDLHALTPSNRLIYYGNKKVKGGELDIDKNATRGDPEPVENIIWKNPEEGKYRIFVNLYRKRIPRESTPFQIELSAFGEELYFVGTAVALRQKIHIVTFEVRDGKIQNVERMASSGIEQKKLNELLQASTAQATEEVPEPPPVVEPEPVPVAEPPPVAETKPEPVTKTESVSGVEPLTEPAVEQEVALQETDDEAPLSGDFDNLISLDKEKAQEIRKRLNIFRRSIKSDSEVRETLEKADLQTLNDEIVKFLSQKYFLEAQLNKMNKDPYIHDEELLKDRYIDLNTKVTSLMKKIDLYESANSSNPGLNSIQLLVGGNELDVKLSDGQKMRFSSKAEGLKSFQAWLQGRDAQKDVLEIGIKPSGVATYRQVDKLVELLNFKNITNPVDENMEIH